MVNNPKTVTAYIHAFGPKFDKEDIPKIIDPKFSDAVGGPYEFNKELLESFFELPVAALSAQVLERYVEVSDGFYLPIAPFTPRIGDRLLKPLKSAKRNYCMGDFSAAIASCGMVGEMLAVLIWKINDVQLKGRKISQAEEKGMFGETFERLGQEKRLRILKTCEFINEFQHQLFIEIKNSRNRYLHSWAIDTSDEKQVALEATRKSFRLFQEITQIGTGDQGTIVMNPLLLKLFKENGEPV